MGLCQLLLTLLPFLNGSFTIPSEKQVSLSVCLVIYKRCLVADSCRSQSGHNLCFFPSFILLSQSASHSFSIIIVRLLRAMQGDMYTKIIKEFLHTCLHIKGITKYFVLLFTLKKKKLLTDTKWKAYQKP